MARWRRDSDGLPEAICSAVRLPPDSGGVFWTVPVKSVGTSRRSRPTTAAAVPSEWAAMVAMMAAAGRANELRVHLKGALKNGCSPEEIREILLLVAMYCGIPAANEAHQAAVEVFKEAERS